MASGSELAVKKVEPSWTEGPTEDVVQALMETLVDPLLPLRVSNVPPTENAQKSVAKQMHAVVLLYNYYHRKQKPELAFLDFVNFCKLAVVVRPPLIAFMKLMMESESIKLSGNEDQLSVTEKAVKDACGIAVALDASRDVPNTEGWPISKVAVLLIDSKTSADAEGVWSLMEKEIIEPSINRETSTDGKVGYKRKQNRQEASTYDPEFLQPAYDAVKEVTGINCSDLKVLETHVTYSLSKEKSAARFYIMQCRGSLFSISKQVPLKFLIERLQGPLAEKVAYGFWRTTEVVGFHHMLPYAAFVSCWLSGNEPTQRGPSQSRVIVNNAMAKFYIGFDVTDSATNEANRIKLEISDTINDDQKKGFVAGPSTGLSGNMVIDDDATEKFQDASKKLSSKIRVYHHRRKNNSSSPKNVHVGEDGANLKVDMMDSSNLYHSHCRDKKVSKDNGNAITAFNQNDIAETGNQVVLFEAKTKQNVEVQSLSTSEDLQNALTLLYKKRQEQYSRICSMEDRLALYEDKIARIRDGGDVGLARQCIKSIVNGDYNLLLEHGTQKHDKGHHRHGEDNSKSRLEQTGFSETYLPGKSSCQDLEYTCIKNNWRLPRYLTESSDGKFVSYVVVEGKCFKLHSKGGFESKPCEARESAAGQMIAKIRNSCV